MSTAIQLLYTTAAFPAESRALLENILFTAFGITCYEAIYDPEFDGLSPVDLFKKRNFAFSNRQYAFIADNRTLDELHANMLPTVLVVSARSTTATDQWRAYNGPGDLSLLKPQVRIALLRSMAQERFALDKYTEAWFWEELERPYDINARLWQIKVLRADPAGASYARIEYSVKDRDALHARFVTEAAKTDGVFRGLKL